MQPVPAPTPTSPVYYGKPAIRFAVESRPLGFDPDGNARWLVLTKFFDAQGKPTHIMANSDFDWFSSSGYVQWQTRLRFGQPSAILKSQRDGPLIMRIRANKPGLGTIVASTDTRAWPGPRVVAQPLGPRAVRIGWFPQEQRVVRIVRTDSAAGSHTVAIIAGPSSSYLDTSVLPARRYSYVVYRADRPAQRVRGIETPSEPMPTSAANASGKGMWLYFTTNPLDPIYYKRLDPKAIVAQAVRAGLHYVELRTAYGAYWEITPEAKPTIDAIIDGLAQRGIGTIGWTVPRDTTFEDLAASVRTAYYRTANGTPLTGLAVDLERGDEFMGGAPQGREALWQYVQFLREALGPRYLLVSTVEDAYLENLDERSYPYAQIAQYSDVLQPMSYWRMLRRNATNAAAVQTIVRASYDMVLRQAGRAMPVSLGGQTNGLGPNGSPPATEIAASLQASRAAGAIGECFFAWDGTQPEQWDALSAYPW